MTTLYPWHHLAHQLADHSAHRLAHRLAHQMADQSAHLMAHHRFAYPVHASALVNAQKSGDTGWRHLLESAPEALRLLLSKIQSSSVVIASVVATSAVLVVAMRRFALHRYLSRRVPLVRLVPTPNFDPSPEEVFRFASTVLRTHRATGLLGVRRGSGVRIRIGSEAGLVVFDLEGHRRVESLLRVASYGSVERRVLRGPDSGTAHGLPGAGAVAGGATAGGGAAGGGAVIVASSAEGPREVRGDVGDEVDDGWGDGDGSDG